MANNPFKDERLTTFENIICGWPLILVFIGGAIGGLCGALAWAWNRKIMLKKEMGWLRFPAIFFAGLAGFLLYFVIVVIIAILFPGLFPE